MASDVLDPPEKHVCGPLSTAPALTDSSICGPRLETGGMERAVLHGWSHSLKLVLPTVKGAQAVTPNWGPEKKRQARRSVSPRRQELASLIEDILQRCSFPQPDSSRLSFDESKRELTVGGWRWGREVYGIFL